MVGIEARTPREGSRQGEREEVGSEEVGSEELGKVKWATGEGNTPSGVLECV